METDEEIFKALVRRNRDLIWRVCSSYRLSAAWTTGRSEERTWVFRVATNTMISLSRKTSNQPTAPPPERYDPGYRDDDFRDLVTLIEATPEPDRTIVKAHAQGFGYKEIADITGLTVAAVSMRLTRALRKLRKQYNQ